MRVADRVADRVTDVSDRVHARRLESKRDSLDRDNERLRVELRATRDELERERSARDELLDAFTKREDGATIKAKDVKVKTKRRGGLLRLLVVGGGAYVLGTRAGRERYEQIKGWASDMKGRMRGAGEDEWRSTPDAASGMSSDMSGMPGATGSGTGIGSTATSGTTGTDTSTGSTSPSASKSTSKHTESSGPASL